MLKPCKLCGGAGFYKSEEGGPEDKSPRMYHKYWVSRTDRRDKPGEKHHGCHLFVLDADHDRFAIPALRAYAAACDKELPELSRDLRVLATEMERRMPGVSHYMRNAPSGHVGLSNVTVKRETQPGDERRGAILVRVKGRVGEHWIPKYRIHDDSEVWRAGTSGTLIIPLELAEEKGLA